MKKNLRETEVKEVIEKKLKEKFKIDVIAFSVGDYRKTFSGYGTYVIQASIVKDNMPLILHHYKCILIMIISNNDWTRLIYKGDIDKYLEESELFIGYINGQSIYSNFFFRKLEKGEDINEFRNRCACLTNQRLSGHVPDMDDCIRLCNCKCHILKYDEDKRQKMLNLIYKNMNEIGYECVDLSYHKGKDIIFRKDVVYKKTVEVLISPELISHWLYYGENMEFKITIEKEEIKYCFSFLSFLKKETKIVRNIQKILG